MNDVNVATNETVDTREIEYIPFNKLMKGARNVRQVKSDRGADKQLIANIKALGVLQNLVVEPSPSKDGLFEVIAGGRRWSSVGVLVKAGDLPDDYSMPCKIQTQGSVAATSLAENILRACRLPTSSRLSPPCVSRA